MKDNKYAPYILGPILLIVWGLVFYKIYQAVYGDGEAYALPVYQPITTFDKPQKDSGYVLLVNYKDPFLGKKWAQSNASTTRRIPSTSPRPKPKPVVPVQVPTAVATPPKPFPSIQYQAFQAMQGDTTAFLKIADKAFYTLRKGDERKGVLIQQIFKDSIQLVFDGQAKTFLRKRH